MKLRNKKTGEIGNLVINISPNRKSYSVCGNLVLADYDSFAELNKEWGDVLEEPKEYWCIDWTGGVNHITALDDVDKYEENKKEIGNYFETEEEAERAVEKLKAWKRLKDKGFRFNGYDLGYDTNKEFCGKALFDGGPFCFEVRKDLDLLFGGE